MEVLGGWRCDGGNAGYYSMEEDNNMANAENGE
jgi:hypothetical protein